MSGSDVIDPLNINGCEKREDTLVLLEGAARTYRTGNVSVHALHPLDLCLQRGDFVSVMGPSGSGKSTLLHILGCLDRPSAGRARRCRPDGST